MSLSSVMEKSKMVHESLEKIRAVLFDFDETLINSPKGLEAAHEAVADKICSLYSCQNTGFSREEMIKELSDFDDRMNLKRNYDRDDWWPKFLDELGIKKDLNQNQIEEITDIYWETYQESAPPYPDAKSVLEYLDRRGYSLGIVTDTDGAGIPKRERVTRFDFSKLFKVIIVAGKDTAKSKPDPECFELATKELQIDPKECVMVGDKVFTDIRGAKKFGMKSILVKRRNWGMEEDPDYIIQNLNELKDLL